MIKQFYKNEDKQVVLNYIGENYYKCIYLYLDLCEYNIEDEEISCWGQYNNCELSSVMLKYHNAIHIFSDKLNYDKNELIHHLATLNFSIICARAEIIENISGAFTDYTPEIGVVSRLYEMDDIEDCTIEEANDDDLREIAELIYSDEDSGASYNLSDLISQMKERKEKKFSRNYVIKKNGVVVANTSTGGETDKMATLNNLIVRKEYRKLGLASKLYRKLCSQLLSEGKEVYSIYYVPESVALHNKMGFVECCKYGKLFKQID